VYEWICEVLEKSVSSWYVSVPALKFLAMLGDGIGALRGKRFVFNSDAMKKLVGSTCDSSDLIQNGLGFRRERNLQESLGKIVVALRLV